MKNKKRLFISLTLALVLFSLTVTTAFCIWYISDVKESTPEYVDDPITEYFDGTSIKYNGNFLLPTSRVFDDASEIDTSNLEYWYQGENDSEYIKCVDGKSGPQNAGKYNIKIKYKVKYTDESGICHFEDKEKVITFTILPIDISDISNKYQAIFKSHSDYRFEYYSCDNKNYTSHNPVIPSDLQVYNTESSKILTIDKEYTVVYTNNTGDAGTVAVATITGCGNYTGIIKLKYIIYKQLYLSGDTAQSTTYNGSNQTPVVVVKDEAGNIIDSSEYEISYNTNAVNVKSTPYDIKVTVTPNDTNKYKGCSSNYSLTINPQRISLTSYLNENTAFPTSYNGIKKWADFKKLINSITFDIADFKDYNLFGISDGTFIYCDTDKEQQLSTKMRELNYTSFKNNYTYVAGSTYLGYIEITNANYVISGQDYIYIKYKTAKIGSTSYYTIEDAIKESSTGKITLPGNLTTKEAEVQITAFSRILTTKSYTNSSHNLIVPYASENTDQSYSRLEATTPSSYNICSCLYIPEGITYETTKPLYITSQISCSGCVGDHGVIINDGIMNFNAGSSINAYGFLKGNGEVKVSNGVTAMDVMTFKDYPGSFKKTASVSKTCFPIFAWVLNNISCRTKYMVGSTLKCFASVWGSSIGYQTMEVTIIGSSTSVVDCLFVPSSNADTTNDYIEKYTNSSACNDSFTYYNQHKDGKKVLSDIYVNGLYEDKKLNLEKGASIYTVYLSTGCDRPLPLSYTNVNVSRGIFKMSNSSYIFLQGTQLIVNSGAKLIVDGDASIAFDKAGNSGLCKYFNSLAISQKDAVFVVNGEVSGTGSVSGTIETNAENASIMLGSYFIQSGKIAYKTSKETGSKNTNELPSQYRKYDIISGEIESNYTTISNGEYTSIKVGDEYGWLVNKAIISYNVNGAQTTYPSKTVDITSNGYQLTENDLPGIPVKEHYTFVKWTLNGADPVGQIIYGGVELIANYKAIDYTIRYHDVNGESVSGESTWNNGNTFNFETNIDLNKAVRGDLVFGGWYLESELTNNVTRLKGSELVNYLDNGILHLYASWYPKGTEQYTIYYDNTASNGSPCISSRSITVTDGFDWNSVVLENSVKELDGDRTITTYFEGWYNGDSMVTSVNAEMFDENKELTLVARYAEKNELKLKAQNSVLYSIYYKPNSYVLTIPELNYEIPGNNVFIRWILSNGTTEQYPGIGDKITLTDETELKADIRQYVSMVIGTNDYTTATITFKENTGYFVEVTGDSKTITAITANNTKSNGTTVYVTKDTKYTGTYNYTGNNGDGGLKIKEGDNASKDFAVGTEYTVGELNIQIELEGTNSSTCLVEGTLITLADGTKKAVEDLRIGDLVMSLNHLTGLIEYNEVIIVVRTYDIVNKTTLYFNDGTSLGTINGHGLFDVGLNKYVEITHNNVDEYVGHNFVSIDINGNITTKILTGYKYEKCYEYKYDIVTHNTLNYVAEDMLSVTHVLVSIINTFDFADGLVYDQKSMAEEIEKYGLYDYSEWEWIIDEKGFIDYNIPIMKIGVCKGLYTKEYIEYLIRTYVLNKDVQITD